MLQDGDTPLIFLMKGKDVEEVEELVDNIDVQEGVSVNTSYPQYYYCIIVIRRVAQQSLVSISKPLNFSVKVELTLTYGTRY